MRDRRAPRLDGRLLPLAPLIFLLPALIIGMLAMHVWIGGHETIDGHTPGGPSTSIESIGTAPTASSHSLLATGDDSSPGVTAPQPGHDADPQCGHGCGSMDMAMATCMLALVLLTLSLLVPPTVGPLRRDLTVWRTQPLLSWTSATARTPSLVQLSISRT